MIEQLWAGFDGLDPSFDPYLFDTSEETAEETARRVREPLAVGALAV